MKINNLKSSTNLISHGLVFKEMRNIKNIVALFGKNGSGKSRLLNQLTYEIQNLIFDLRETETQIHNHLQLQKSQVTISELQIKQLSTLKAKKENLLSCLIGYEENNFPIIQISSRETNIIPNTNMHESEYRVGTLHILTNPDFSSIKKNCAKLIKSLCKSEIAKDYHKNVPNKELYKSHNETQDENIRLYNHLKQVIKEVMHKKLDYYVDEHLTPTLTLNNRELIIEELSDGEKELLAYCTYLVFQQQDSILNKTLSLKGKILILDEPELFLHPEAQIDLINGLRNLVGEYGQIWLATHSLAILSILDRDEIWLMEDGDIISPSIETPNKVISSLIGEKNLDSLENFVSSQYEWASIQFALESLFPPAVIPYKENDVQQGQAKERLLTTEKTLKILDFGAGKGRIAQEILRNPSLASNIYYQALETTPEDYENLKKLTSDLQKISHIETETEREVLDTHEKLNERQYDCFFDYVFMINVLHEIPSNKWESVLNAILKSLNPSGSLIILEDQALPRGENAHEYGFLILDIEEFKILFSQKNSLKTHEHPDSRYSKRLSCIEIPKKYSIVNRESISESLKRKKTNCKTSINQLRHKENKNAKDGRLNSFFTQLYANVDMALEDFSKKS